MRSGETAESHQGSRNRSVDALGECQQFLIGFADDDTAAGIDKGFLRLRDGIRGLTDSCGITLDGQMTPSSYNPLRYTFLIWVMVIVGGSGNNWGSVLGGLLIWYLWIKAEAWGPQMMDLVTANLSEGALKQHLVDSAAHMRLIVMGLVLLLVLRFSPRGLLPER
mgnify:CR=1 FL=1